MDSKSVPRNNRKKSMRKMRKAAAKLTGVRGFFGKKDGAEQTPQSGLLASASADAKTAPPENGAAASPPPATAAALPNGATHPPGPATPGAAASPAEVDPEEAARDDTAPSEPVSQNQDDAAPAGGAEEPAAGSGEASPPKGAVHFSPVVLSPMLPSEVAGAGGPLALATGKAVAGGGGIRVEPAPPAGCLMAKPAKFDVVVPAAVCGFLADAKPPAQDMTVAHGYGDFAALHGHLVGLLPSTAKIPDLPGAPAPPMLCGCGGAAAAEAETAEDLARYLEGVFALEKAALQPARDQLAAFVGIFHEI